MTGSAPVGPVLDLLDRCRDGLLQACAAGHAGDRYVAAHLAALRAAAAVIAARPAPCPPRGGRGGRAGRGRPPGRPRSVWQVLPGIAPELGEWAEFFAAGAVRRAAVEAGRTDVVSTRDADDLLRQSELFHAAVEHLLGLPHRVDVRSGGLHRLAPLLP